MTPARPPSPRPLGATLARALFGVAVACGGPAAGSAADLPGGVLPAAPPVPGPFGGGYHVPLWPVRPAPHRFDIYGYPVPPSPLEAGVGCPAALAPAYDADGNLAGYAPLQACR